MVSNSKGLTLLEIMAATVILGLVVLTFVSVSQYKLLSDRTTDNQGEALSLAQNQLDTARSALMNTSQSVPEDQRIDLGGNRSYNVHYRLTVLGTSGVTFDPAAQGSRQVSLQSMILHGSKPSLLTVTVSWVQP